MRAIPIFIAAVLMAGTAVAQTSGGGGAGGGAGSASSSGGSAATTGSSPSGAVGSSPSGASAITQRGTSATTGSTAGSANNGLRTPAQGEAVNPDGTVNAPPLGSGGPTKASACQANDKRCGTRFEARYMRLVDSMVKIACPGCAR